MKLLTLFLSLIVLTLTSVPCCELENNDEMQHNVQQNSETEDDCSQSCSPFYTCGACVGFTVADYSKEISAVYLRPIHHNSIYPPFKLPQTMASIWQPPQLS